MKKISLVVPEFFQNNRIFDETNEAVNRDDCQRPFIELKKALLKDDIELSTNDVIPIQNADGVIFFNIPQPTDPFFLEARKKGVLLYAIINELGFILKENLDTNLHRAFTKLFTYQDDLIDNLKYFKVNYSFQFPSRIPRDEKTKFCTLIAGNKSLNHGQELYSKRVETIRWFEKHHPEQFDLFGVGWDELPDFKIPLINKILKKIPGVSSLFPLAYPSYRGKIGRKNEVLRKYKFAICYENAKDVPGWITEKMFDCFFAGCIPVYWGANNVDRYVPRECFIDRTAFLTHEDLYSYLAKMSPNDHESFLRAMEEFIGSEKANFFSVRYFVETIEREIKKDLQTAVPAL